MFMFWGTEKKKQLGDTMDINIREVIRVNEEYVISFSRMGKLSHRRPDDRE